MRLRGIGNVGGECHGLAPIGGDGVGGDLRFFEGNIEHEDPRALMGEEACHGPANLPPAPADDRDAAFEQMM